MIQHEPGDVLARRYVLLDRIASGGTSVLWRARDRALERLVAVKVLQEERELARKEARTTARLAHPDAIEVYDYGETVTAHGRVAAFVVLRLLDGVPLAERLAGGRLPWREAAVTAARLARVLEAAHRQGIVHRDVSAENVLLTGSGPKLLDFGIAAPAGDPDDQRGTPPYVSPERLAGALVHPAADVYALGALLYQMLTGSLPYPETTWEELERSRRTGPCPRPEGVPHELAALCRRCLDPAPWRRPEARQVAEELARTLARHRVRREVRRAASLAALVAFGGLVLWPGLPVPGPGGPFPAPSGPVVTGPSPAVSGPQPQGTAADLPAAAPLASPSARYTLAVSPPRALDRFHAELEAGAASGRIRPDVALDLRQTLAHAASPREVAEVRRKLGDRLREKALEPGLGGELDALLTEIAASYRVG